MASRPATQQRSHDAARAIVRGATIYGARTETTGKRNMGAFLGQRRRRVSEWTVH
jgi:hypothetical protein